MKRYYGQNVHQKKFECIGLDEIALMQIFKKYGYTLTEVYCDMGRVTFELKELEYPDEITEENEEIFDIPYKILNIHFGQEVTVFSADTDQDFPFMVMVLLDPDENSKKDVLS